MEIVTSIQNNDQSVMTYFDFFYPITFAGSQILPYLQQCLPRSRRKDPDYRHPDHFSEIGHKLRGSAISP